jgi:hypothetical protein
MTQIEAFHMPVHVTPVILFSFTLKMLITQNMLLFETVIDFGIIY